jgi:AcrR family transcriptional regulator
MAPRKSPPRITSGIDERRKAALRDGNEAYKARRAEIIHVAAHVFRELGYEAATLNDVAKQLGTDRASVYYYVASKEELLHEIVRDVLVRNLEAAETIRRRRAPVPEKIEALIAEMITSFDENYPHMYVYIEDMGRVARQDSEWARDVVHHTKRFESIVMDILEKGRREGSLKAEIPAELSALSLFGMVNWTYRWYRPGSKYTPQDIARAFSSLFLSGVASGRSG